MLPPAAEFLFLVVEVEELSDHGCCNIQLRRFVELGYLHERLIPRVLPQLKFGRVNREKPSGVQIKTGFQHLFREGVDIPPGLIVLPILQNGEIEISESAADFGKVSIVPAIATEEYSFRRSLEYIGSP